MGASSSAPVSGACVPFTTTATVSASCVPFTTTATVSASAVTSTTTATSIKTSTFTATSTTTATPIKTDVTTAVSTLTVTLTSTIVSSKTDSFTTTATVSASTLSPSVCTFTFTSTTTTYTSTKNSIPTVYTLPTKCYNSAILQSLLPPTTTPSLVPPVSLSTTYACSATVQILSTVTVSTVYSPTATVAWPFYVQAADCQINKGNYGKIVTYEANVGNSFLTFTEQNRTTATQMSLDDNCSLTLGYNTSNPDWYAVDQGNTLTYFGNTAEIGQYSHNATCLVDAFSVLTCRTSYGNTTYLNGNDTRDSRFNNDLNVAAANLTTNSLFNTPIYPVKLVLSFLPAPLP